MFIKWWKYNDSCIYDWFAINIYTLSKKLKLQSDYITTLDMTKQTILVINRIKSIRTNDLLRNCVQDFRVLMEDFKSVMKIAQGN